MKKNADAETLYAIAEFLRHKGDTTYKSWYIHYIEVAGAQLDCNKNKVYKECLLLMFAKAYYYTGDLKQAESFLNKAIATRCPDSCLDYYTNVMKQANAK